MPEVPDAREDHGDLVFIAGFNYFCVGYGTSGLDYGLDFKLGRKGNCVFFGKEGIRGQ